MPGFQQADFGDQRNVVSDAQSPKLPAFVNGKDELDSYLLRFERFATNASWHRDGWATKLSALLTGRALEVYSRMSDTDAVDYDRVKVALLTRYDFTENGYLNQFHEIKSESPESPDQLIVRLKNYFAKWVELSGTAATYDGVTDLMVKEQFIGACTRDLAVYHKERAPKDLDELAVIAKQYLVAHGRQLSTKDQERRKDNKTAIRNTNVGQGSSIRCYVCQGVGHRAAQCPSRVTDVTMIKVNSSFNRLGVPEEVLSDMGNQFVSECMQEVSRLLSIKRLISTPYHPICNGLVEKFNGTLKKMLKLLCHEQPRQWHRYISALLFAYREVPQESTGFSPFELLYGRTVRGPMKILKELWTKESDTPEIVNNYQYVFELRDRLEQTLEIAREELQKAQNRYKCYYHRKTKKCVLKEGDKVLILLPTDNNKLLLQCKGPYVVIGENNYRVRVGDKVKTYHVNMLKLYVERETSPQPDGSETSYSPNTTIDLMNAVHAATVGCNESDEENAVDEDDLL
ncbi:uncharacterized protein LOC144348042 [Saccoglossus kowalevskii]